MRYVLTILSLVALMGVSSVNAKENSITANDDQLSCLALNIYHESRGESIMGQIAVGFVTLNRVASKLYPDTICNVVKQAITRNGKPILNRCQFSWWCDGRSDKPHNKEAWMVSQAIANSVLGAYNRDELDITQGSLWYHAAYVNPKWAKNLVQTVRFNDHIFYTAPK